MEDMRRQWSHAADTSLDQSQSPQILRQAIGALGTLFPLILWTTVLVRGGDTAVESSISAYYSTPARDVFVGILVAIGVFLLFYRPYRLDFWLTSAAGVLAVVVAWFPSGGEVAAVHYAAAVGLFLLLALITLVLFTRGVGGGQPGPGKIRENRVYRVCGWTILAGLALAALARVTGFLDWLPAYLFWIEAVMLVAFGVAWYVKGLAGYRRTQSESSGSGHKSP